MPNNNYLAMFKHIFLMLFLGVVLVACDKGSEDSNLVEAEVLVPTLSDANIKAFTIKMAADYKENLNSLMAGFQSAKKEGNEYQFVNFRNHTWTPAYIKQKDYYQKVFENNASYLAQSPSKPLFDKFESLIYVGITLKNALLDKDDVKLKAQLAVIENDKNIVNNMVQ